ncbi:hypothetical protein FHS31_000797 [Sphingomonas vulcanisoli]|uniref:Uncharacterized protein n=1 Tax=Sphingomonas vulcanisoli TaxID=1658060 RepID=A0ABX0TNV5_9SPHN|nr:hypothetical protein [Sphingomonas vulcanisoli]NIJ07201.1 hypothetical protein [Sphingomonas vulcanisoli]
MRDAQQLQQQCDDFNARYPVGQAVSMRHDAGDERVTKTRSKAEVLSGHAAVIWLEGVSGCYLLDRITPLVGQEAA